jgi:hypothetical protein
MQAATTMGPDRAAASVAYLIGPGATLGATGADNLGVIQTNMNSGQGRVRGHGLI